MKLLSILLLFFFGSCSTNKDIQERIRLECFDKMEKALLDSNIATLNFKVEIDCFKWDSVSMIQYLFRKREDLMKLNYKIIDYKANGKFLYSRFKSDQDNDNGSWTYFYFYKNGKLLNDAIAIHRRVLDFSDIKYFDVNVSLRKEVDTLNFFYNEKLIKTYSVRAKIE